MKFQLNDKFLKKKSTILICLQPNSPNKNEKAENSDKIRYEKGDGTMDDVIIICYIYIVVYMEKCYNLKVF